MSDTQRKLVTIRTVGEILPIDGADAIETAKVDGWQCVVKKGVFRPGDLGVYCEIDSFMPVRPEFEFLRKGCYKRLADGSEGFRIRTIRLRKTLSQGLLLPMTDFPGMSTEIGADVTEALGVIKYEPPIPAQLSGKIRGNFPGFLRKTDQERIQNLYGKYAESFRDQWFEATVKLDGSSCTVYRRDESFGVCSRNLDLVEDDANSFWNVVNRLGLRDVLSRYGKNIALQGELVGEGIQKNAERLTGQHFYLFDVFDIDAQRYLTPDERYIVLKDLIVLIHEGRAPVVGDILKHVPVIDTFKPFLQMNLEQILEYAEGKSINSDNREGVVFKSADRIDGEVVSFKAISNRYLLEEET